jgi:lyso-ornithine lipid O-acyltransferase
MTVESNSGRKKPTDRSERRSSLLADPGRTPGFLLELPTGREGWLVARRVRVFRRGLAVLLWTIAAALIQAVCLLLPGRAKIGFARLYWAVLTRLMGIRVRVIGSPVIATGGRPVVFVSNHSSWVDVPVVGGVLDGCFVAKGDVATWPVISTIARLGRTVFVTRSRTSTGATT